MCDLYVRRSAGGRWRSQWLLPSRPSLVMLGEAIVGSEPLKSADVKLDDLPLKFPMVKLDDLVVFSW